jgi:hypothetical protein
MSGWERDLETAALAHLTRAVGDEKGARQIINGLIAKGREQRDAEVEALLTERHTTNEALSEAAEAIRAKDQRIAELEQQAAVVAEFVAARAEYITSIRNCHPDNGHDYDRWQGHAESRRQLAETLGLPVAWPPAVEDGERS